MRLLVDARAARTALLRRSRMPIILLALAASQVAYASSYVVTANPDLTFTPTHLTIALGDQVIFENDGGLHNVRADNNSFWCADDCSLHRSPSSRAWQNTVTFNALGTIGYYCEQHGDTTGGMRGFITVQRAAATTPAPVPATGATFLLLFICGLALSATRRFLRYRRASSPAG